MESIQRKLTALLILLPIALVVCLLPAPAWATIEEGDQSQPTDEEVAAAIEAGLISTDVSQSIASGGGVDEGDELPYVALGAQSDLSLFTQSSKVSSSPYTINEYSGATMFETAVAQATAAYTTSEYAIIAGPGDAWVDALSAAGLAGGVNCPILFSEKNSMHEATMAALKQLGVSKVIIVGGPAAVGAGVEKDLESAGITVEARLGGKDCYDTQMKIYEYGLENNYWSGDLAIIATGTWFGDALSVSPVAYKLKAPIFLVGKTKTLNSAQMAAWKKAAEDGMFKNIEAVGGEAVVSPKAIAFGNEMIKKAGGTGEVAWEWGQTQYETSTAIASHAVKYQGFKWNNVAFTTGNQPYDALAGSVYQGATSSVMLLADSAYASTIGAAYAHHSDIKTMRFFGGKRALASNTRIGIADAFGIPYASIPNFKLYLDAGHGYNDMNNGYYSGGATGNGYVEYELTYELSHLVYNILHDEYGVDIFLNDDGGPYRYRHAEAVAQGCDMIVSIHFNAAGGSGSLTLVHSYNNAEMSWPLAEQVHPYLVSSMGLYDYGVRPQAVAILGGQLPAILLEICFIDNWYDMQIYQANKSTVARNIAYGIIAKP